MPDRPTVFFSHAGADKQALVQLKDLFSAKVGGSIEVFLSSDGQSIPLGRNWVHKVQEALDRTVLMVIFITPSALTSGWVYFESGYAYSKGIRVVPVGFLGIDLAQMNPPLSLLQGFNIFSADGLNNLVALVNDVCGHKHREQFSDDEFREITAAAGTSSPPLFGEVGRLLEEVSFTLNDSDLRESADSFLQEASRELTKASIPFHSGQGDILASGFFLRYSGYNETTPGIRMEADPLLLSLSYPVLHDILKTARKGGVVDSEFNFELKPGVEVIQDRHKITARVYGTKIKFDKKGELRFDDVTFRTGYFYGNTRGNAYVSITLKTKAASLKSIAELLELLYQKGIIFRPMTFEDYVGP